MALLLANARYWPTVAPTVRRQLQRWQRRAQAIPDPYLREVALAALHAESFNAAATSTLATLATLRARARVTEAIVALQVMYDYLDALAERTAPDSAASGELFRALEDAVTPGTQDRDRYCDRPQHADDGYLADLTDTVRATLTALAASAAVTPQAQRAAHRCAEAQRLAHMTAAKDGWQLQAWAEREAASSGLRWRVFLAGAVTSALSVHALIVAGADRRTTPTQARAIDATYLSIGALSTMLDSLIDYEHDISGNTQWYLRHYGDRTTLAEDLADTARLALTQTRALAHRACHVMTLVGVAAYYLSAPEASHEPARSLTVRLQQELQPLITPTLALMRAWRAARRRRDGLATPSGARRE